MQVRPSVVDGDLAAGTAEYRDGRAKRHPRRALESHENPSAPGLLHLRIVVPAADLQVRRTQRIDLQAAKHIAIGLKPRPHQHAILVRMADHGLPNRIQLVLRDIDDLETKRRFVDEVELHRFIALFLSFMLYIG
jgi:hypothetical protein